MSADVIGEVALKTGFPSQGTTKPVRVGTSEREGKSNSPYGATEVF